MIRTIYFDMDGVTVDLDHSLSRILGRELREVAPEHLPTSDEFVKKLIRDNLSSGVFEKAPPGPDFDKFKELMAACSAGYAVEILSSCMEAKSYDEIKRQKTVWLVKHGLGQYKRNFTVSGRAKAYWAEPTSILVDDMKQNCEWFRKASGKAVQYRWGHFEEAKKAILHLLG